MSEQNVIQPVYTVPVRRKSPGVHGLLSALVPGLGSMMAGDAAFGALLLLGVWVFAPVIYIVFMMIGASISDSGAAIAWVLVILAHCAAYVYGIVRAVSQTRRWNGARGL